MREYDDDPLGSMKLVHQLVLPCYVRILELRTVKPRASAPRVPSLYRFVVTEPDVRARVLHSLCHTSATPSGI
jgi:hypothetical protein